MIAGREIEDLSSQLQGRPPLEQQHPLVLRLVIQDRIRCIAAQDALDADVATAEQLAEGLAAIGTSRAGEEILGWREP